MLRCSPSSLSCKQRGVFRARPQVDKLIALSPLIVPGTSTVGLVEISWTAAYSHEMSARPQICPAAAGVTVGRVGYARHHSAAALQTALPGGTARIGTSSPHRAAALRPHHAQLSCRAPESPPRNCVIGRVGFEPTRALPRRILSPLRLPFRHLPAGSRQADLSRRRCPCQPSDSSVHPGVCARTFAAFCTCSA